MLYHITNTEFHGKAMVAMQDIEPGPDGFTILKEDAILRMPPTGSNDDMSGPMPSILDKFDPQIWTDWCIFRKQPDEVKQKILDMYHEMDCNHATWLLKYLTDKDDEQKQHQSMENNDEKEDEEEKLYSIDRSRNDDEEMSRWILDHIDEFVRFTMVVRFNSANLIPAAADGDGPGQDMGHGLFVQAGKLTHSCRPNCSWFTTTDGKGKVIRAIQPITKGEELTVDYLGGELYPLPQRRSELLESKGFICHCTRCEEAAQDGDDTRRFPCASNRNEGNDAKVNNCNGVHFLIQPLASSRPQLSACTVCQQKASQEYVDYCCQMEISMSQELRELDVIIARNGNQPVRRHNVGDEQKEQDYEEGLYQDTLDITQRIEKLEPPHHFHCLASKIYGMKGNQYLKRNQYQMAADAFAKQVAVRNAILGDSNTNDTTAWCVERVGDALRHINLDEAKEAYQETIRTLTFTRGQSDPYCSCAIHKLSEVQSRKKVDCHDTEN